MTARTAPRAVTFDYWNTLCYEPDLDQRRGLVLGAWTEILAAAGLEIDTDRLGAAYDAARDEHTRGWLENRQFTADDAARMCVAHLDGTGSLAAVEDALCEAFHACSDSIEIRPVAGVGELLCALEAEGVRMGIVCDVGFTASPYLREHLGRNGLLGHFDHWSFSDEVGVYKPDRRIFEHALEGLGGLAPGEAAHVGDRRRTDIAGAQAMGMRAVRFTGVFDDDDPEEGPSGDAVVARYDELLAAIGLG